jgi:DNA polymerase-3 subunit delta
VVALRGKEIDAFLTRPDPSRPIILLYGPDTGLVRERADALMASAVDDPNDPFSLVRMDGDELAAEPSRLVEEAMTVPLFGGRRAIRIRAGTRSFASGIDTLAEMQPKDCRIVIEAGELRPDAPLRKACEKAKTAVAIACYADTERDLAKLIDDELRASNLRIAPDARAALTSLLGGDRQASRNEIRKVALYAHGKGEVTLDDVLAIVTDASGLALDPIVDSAFAGRAADVEALFAKAIAAGTYPGLIIMSRSVMRRCSTRRDYLSMKAAVNLRRLRADFRGCTSRARRWSRRRCATQARNAWRVPWRNLPTRHSTCANNHRWPKLSVSARCWLLP